MHEAYADKIYLLQKNQMNVTVDLTFLRDWQKDFIKQAKQYNVLVIHRRAWKTTVCIAYLLYKALQGKGYYGYIAPTYEVDWQLIGFSWIYCSLTFHPIIKKKQIDQIINKMNKTNNKDDKSTWTIGGTTLIGIGVGLIFLKTSALLFVASILIGIGSGLVITSLISRDKK